MLISFYAADWINRQGAAAAFDEMTAIEVASVLLAIPLFFWGRRLRVVTGSYGPMKRHREG